jgi:hypothetical protein
MLFRALDCEVSSIMTALKKRDFERDNGIGGG